MTRAWRAGDLVWLDFSPSRGSEQGGHRPALVVSARRLTEVTSLAIVCPITSQPKGYPTNVPVVGVRDAASRSTRPLIDGEVLCAQVRAVDTRQRGFAYAEQHAPAATLAQARAILKALLQD